ncbi:MAG: hypothetical protein COA80_17995 [Leeuwenhoekiella sp.]|nr:MAG: hypothetical protein COA80_17995 [Leeuwenhoekiella sp.]
MQDIKRLKSLNFFSLVWICFLMYSPFTYGQTTADTIETGIRSGTLDNGMRYLIHSNKAWEGQKVSMNFYVHAGSEMEVEGQTDMAHYFEHLPFTIFHQEAIETGGNLLADIRSGKLPTQGQTHPRHTEYNFFFEKVGSESYHAELSLLSRMIEGRIKPEPEHLTSEQGTFYQEYIYRNGPQNYATKRMLEKFLKAFSPAIPPDDYLDHVKGFNWDAVSSFYNDWYHPQRATLVLVGPISDLDRTEQDIEHYFGKSKATPAKKLVYPQKEYLERPNQFIQLELPEGEEPEVAESEILLYWRNQIPPNSEPIASQQKWMYEMLYELIGDHLRQIPTTYDLHYTLGIDKGTRLPALGLSFTAFTGKEREVVQEVAVGINQLKKQAVDEAVYQKYRQRKLNAIEQRDTTTLGAVLSTYDQRILAEESLEFDQLGLKKNWLNGLSYDTVNSELKAFLKAGPQDIGILAPKDASVLRISEAEFRSWLQQPESDNIEISGVHQTKILPDSLIAQLPQVESKIIETDTLGGRVMQLANGLRVVLYPQESAPLKLHGFRNVGASNLNKKDSIKAHLLPEWVHISGAGSHTHFEMQRMLTDLGMIYGKALYVNQGESGIKLQAPAERLEALLQLAYLYFSAPREDPEAFRYWKEDESLFYKKPPYGREEYDLTVLSKKVLKEANPGLTALERFEAVQQTNLAELKLIYQKLFQHPEEFLFLLSGDFKEAEILPLLETYLGNLPVSENQIKREGKEVNTLPQGPIKKIYTIPGILSSNLNLKIQYSYPIAREDWKSQVDLKLMQQVMKTQLPDLRYVKKRGLYVITATVFTDPQSQRGNLAITLPTIVGMEQTLISDVEELVSLFKKNAITENELNGIKSHFYLSGITGKSILDKGYRYYKWGTILPDPEAVKAYLEGVSPQDIQKLIQEKLVPEHRYIFTGKGVPEVSN